MNSCRKSIWTLVAVTLLLPAGCASQRGRFASRNEINTAQLLAAARQYEKEGQLANAAHIYQHVLKYHPANTEAREGLALVQQGKLRVDFDTETLLASSDPLLSGNPQARQQLAKRHKVTREKVTERMAQLIAQAAERPQTVEVDAAPTQTLVAATVQPEQPQTLAKVESKPIIEPIIEPAEKRAIKREADSSFVAESDADVRGSDVTRIDIPAPAEIVTPADAVAPAEAVAQADAVAPDLPLKKIETTAFDQAEDATNNEDTPADWNDSKWKPHSLTQLCDDASAAVLGEIRKLDDDSDDVRKSGLTQLARMGPEASGAADAIRAMLDDPNQVIGAHAAWALWEVEGDAENAVSKLMSLLGSDSKDVVHFAAYTLGNVGPSAEMAESNLKALYHETDSLTRLHAAEAMAKIATGEARADAVDTLIVLLKDRDAGVRSLAAMTLGEIDEDNAAAAVAALTKALDDESEAVRTAAALSLGAYQKAAGPAVERLKQAADSDITFVRDAAETALACINL